MEIRLRNIHYKGPTLKFPFYYWPHSQKDYLNWSVRSHIHNSTILWNLLKTVLRLNPSEVLTISPWKLTLSEALMLPKYTDTPLNPTKAPSTCKTQIIQSPWNPALVDWLHLAEEGLGFLWQCISKVSFECIDGKLMPSVSVIV